ncbi:hypothetical protein [Virgibacillus dokdonensis]|uniref:hypothetical protein n=1 Tax=Virgibacillus dokdonensis TaxID=302167 RepID=UPI00113009C6|nr:hypothetical protein [Virgibacillus dokdonensis]
MQALNWFWDAEARGDFSNSIVMRELFLKQMGEGRRLYMEKVIMIDAKPIRFKATEDTVERYKKLLKRDFLKDVKKYDVVIKYNINSVTSPPSDLKKVDHYALLHVCWIFAKNANEEIPKLRIWLEDFKQFPVISVFQQINELIAYAITQHARKGRFRGKAKS